MSRRQQSFAGKPPLDLVEEAIALLRSAPVSAYVLYYLGAAPFWLAFLYFVSDMSHGAFAADRLIGGSLGLAALFLWMKCWQAAFASRLEALVLLRPDDDWTIGRIVRLISTQAGIQPWGLIVRPIALAITLPFVWVSAFFQTVTVLGSGIRDHQSSSVSGRAWRQASLWPGQVHLANIWVFLFGFFVFCNVVSAFMVAPGVLKMFFDLETEGSRYLGAAFNSTSLTAAFAITMMCVDPILKALYVLRCFHGDSIRSGLDLRVQLRRLQRALVLSLILISLLLGGVSHGAEAQPPGAPLKREELSESIREVLGRREYAWRTPPKTETRLAENDFRKWIIAKIESLKKWFDSLWKRLFGKKPSAESSGWKDMPLHELAYGLGALLLGLIAFGVWRRMQQDKRNAVLAEPFAAVPDLESEDITADQLPEDGWLELMRKAIAEGQNRTAVRAAYLSTLAHLGRRELLTLARYKSNRDYDRELARRARSRAELLRAFQENLQAFECVWYGDHEVTPPAFEQFKRNLDVIRSC